MSYILDELMNNPNLNRSFFVDPTTYPTISDMSVSTRCFGFIIETTISINDNYTESIRIVTAANGTRKAYLMVRFSDQKAYDSYEDPTSVQYAELKTPGTPISYEDVEIPFVLANLHVYPSEEES